MKPYILWLAVIVGVVTSVVARAHHSAVMFDTSREIVVDGIVTEYDWRNPHVHMVLEITGANGEIREQRVEVGAPSVLAPLGLTPDSLRVGERVSIYGNPNRADVRRSMLGLYLTKADGSQLPLNIGAPSLLEPDDARATSIEGTWFGPLAPFRGFVRSQGNWPLTDKARMERAEWTIEQAAYADCVPVTAPTLMIYPVTTTVEVNDDTVVFEVDWMTSRRVVYLDGRGHPANAEPTLHGHSIGHWEGETLVVDTIHYAAHSEGLTMGVGSGRGKHTVERLSLAADGQHMNYEVIVEDPEYLVEPLTHSSQLEYRPDLEPTGLACDLEAARRYRIDE
jgi:hypothetical protein